MRSFPLYEGAEGASDARYRATPHSGRKRLFAGAQDSTSLLHSFPLYEGVEGASDARVRATPRAGEKRVPT